MRKIKLENWANSIVERVLNNEPVEDSNVELKSDWIDPPKFARLLAGHANAALGDPILWIIGVDELTGEIAPIENKELADWWPMTQKCFESTTPELSTNLVVNL